ncbi:hypothetical protein P4485_32240 [Bacillus thuringiensis]|nr:hypothetical protein [Bacillus cereus]MED3470416.1 hypothetical protein [Bacillus thuringiensis]
MFSLAVGVVLVMMILSLVWFVAEKLGVFEWIGNVALQIKSIFKEEDNK